jgi:DNA-directed RNA polymerase sigma subunit (sigma70/sigma32)
MRDGLLALPRMTAAAGASPGVSAAVVLRDEDPDLDGPGIEEPSGSAPDSIQLYLKEIGEVPLLTAAQEVEIGRRIEAGQTGIRRGLAAAPSAIRHLLRTAEAVRTGERPVDELILLPDGGVAAPRRRRAIRAELGRIARLDGELRRAQARLRHPDAPVQDRAAIRRRLRQLRTSLQDAVAEEIGARFSLTRERIRQIEATSLRRLAQGRAGQLLRELVEA